MRTMIQQKGNSGKHLSTSPPYGYIKDPQNKDNWLVDEHAAGIVRRIFEMYVSGNGMVAIADALYEEKILRPYAYKHGIDNETDHDWKAVTIRVILTNQVYCGDTVNFKSRRISYKNKKSVRNPPEMHKVFYDTHPAIISREMFEQVQELMAIQNRIVKIDRYVQALFESKVRNEITTEVFGNLSKNYMNEKTRLNAEIFDLLLEEAKFKDENLKLNRLYDAVKKCSDADELTRDVLLAFVERIEVGERPKKDDLNQNQEIDIFFYGVGIVDFL